MGEPTITALAFRAVRDIVNDSGHDGQAMLSSVGVDPEGLNADRRVPVRQYHAALRKAAEATDDPCFGLTLAQRRTQPQGFDLLGYLMLHSATLGDAVLRLVRFSGLWAQGIEVSAHAPPEATLRFDFRPPVSQCWPHVQSSVAGSVVVARAITGKAFAPARVTLPLPAPADPTPYVQLFGDTVEFGADVTTMMFTDEAWAYDVSDFDPRLREHLEATAAVLLDRINTDDSIEGRVREYIARHLEPTGVTLASTARALGMSRRTLQRRLAEQDVSFAGLVDGVRRELALHLLEQEGLEVKQAAFRLGFAQPSAFSRAFKRWTGSSPVAYTRM